VVTPSSSCSWLRYSVENRLWVPRAAAFYDTLLGEIGAKRMMENEQFIAWSVTDGQPGLGTGPGGTNSALPCFVTRATRSRIADFAALSFQEGSD